MITAEEARDISNTLQTQRAKECLDVIDDRITSAAAYGYSEIDITDIKPVKAITLYLESIGYEVVTVEDEKYNSPISIKVKW